MSKRSEFRRQFEVEWYRKNGKYPERIAQIKSPDGRASGAPYMVSDWSWNQRNPDKPEAIEPDIEAALIAHEFEMGER